MAKQFLHIEDHLAMLNEYAPYKVAMRMAPDADPYMDGSYDQFTLTGVNFSDKVLVLTKRIEMRKGPAMVTQEHLPAQGQPVLYNLADLPTLPGGDAHHASPCAAVLHSLGFMQRGDYASGEWVNQVTVKSASDTQLHLAFSTTCQPDTSQWSDDDFDQQEPSSAGAAYEVIISATGTVHWRNVTADSLEGEQGQHWRVAEGANVFEAFHYLRQLHVAVGRMAYVHEIWNGKDYDKHYSYVRKQLPAPVQNPLPGTLTP